VDAIMAWLFGTACVAAATEVIARGREGTVFADILKNTPLTPFHALREGAFVRVTGRAIGAGTLLTSPVTGRRGLAFSLSLRGSFDEHVLPSREADIERMAPFFLEDLSRRLIGKVMITPGAAPAPAAALLLDRQPPSLQRGNVLPTAWPALRELVSSRLWDDRLARVARTLRYQETVLEDGAEVTLAGMVGRTVDVAGEAAHGRAPAMLWLIHGQVHRPLIVGSDRSRFLFT